MIIHRSTSAGFAPLAPIVTLAIVAGSLATSAKSPAEVPPLPPPEGAVVRVSSERQLQDAVAGLRSGTTIVIAAGTYRLTRTLHIGNRTLRDVALRGATSSRDDVVLVGPGMTNMAYGEAPNGVWMGSGAQNVLVANLTIKEFYFHPVILNEGTTSPRFYNVRLADGGQQLLKSNPDDAGRGVNNGIVEYSVLEFSSTSRDSYTNGVDVLGGTGWIVRHNLFRNIRAPSGQLAGPTILMWRGSRDTLVESNTFVNCQREIAFGLVEATPDDHRGGTIRNNFIYRDASVQGDAAINVFDSPETRVLHNTILASGTYPNAIEYRFRETKGVTIRNNLTDGAIQSRDGATASIDGNFTEARAGMFVAPARGDLHLRPGTVRRMGNPGAGAEADWDGDVRAPGAPVDVGADQTR